MAQSFLSKARGSKICSQPGRAKTSEPGLPNLIQGPFLPLGEVFYYKEVSQWSYNMVTLANCEYTKKTTESYTFLKGWSMCDYISIKLLLKKKLYD